MKQKNFLLIIVIFLLLAFGAVAFYRNTLVKEYFSTGNKQVVLKEFSNKAYGYSFSYPTDWSVSEGGRTTRIATNPQDELMDIVIDVSGFNQLAMKPDSTLQDYVEISLQTMQQNPNDVKVLSVEDIIIDGRPAVKIVQHQFVSPSNPDIDTVRYLFTNNSDLISITANVEKENYQKLENLVKSFKL